MHDYSSSGPTAVSARSEATLALGRKLTRELSLDESVDTLGRWMAHYVAELIGEAEKANAEERSAKMQACSDAILKLWEHRHLLPNGKRPFEQLEPILRTLETLDPNDDTPRYFRLARASADEADKIGEESEAKFWLKLIDGLDYSARILIRYCLTQAAQTALDKSLEWVALAEAAGATDGVELPLIRIVGDESDLLKPSDPDEKARKQLEDRIDRLDGFTKLSTAFASELRQQIQQVQGAKGGS